MSQHDDQDPGREPGHEPDSEPRLDEDAAWAQIVANYGERPTVAPPPEPTPPVQPPGMAEPFAGNDPLNTPATWEDEGHFVPPEPPPLPKLEPRRKLAWIGLFAPPVVLLLAVVLGWALPTWLATLMVIGFLGGFGYLVATMPRGDGDDWTGDDGAVL